MSIILHLVASAMAEKPKLQAGQIANYWKPGFEKQQTVIVVSVVEHERPHKYQVMDLDTMEESWSLGCWLSLAHPEIQPGSNEWMEMETEMLTGSEAKAPAPVQVNRPARFVNLTEDDLNTLAAQRVSSNTKEQTKWGLKIFHGEFTCFLNLPANLSDSNVMPYLIS